MIDSIHESPLSIKYSFMYSSNIIRTNSFEFNFRKSENDHDRTNCRDIIDSDACKGKYCYSLTYKEVQNGFFGKVHKGWWMRGCTDEEDKCEGYNISNCKVCQQDNCNNDKLPSKAY